MGNAEQPAITQATQNEICKYCPEIGSIESLVAQSLAVGALATGVLLNRQNVAPVAEVVISELDAVGYEFRDNNQPEPAAFWLLAADYVRSAVSKRAPRRVRDAAIHIQAVALGITSNKGCIDFY